MSTSSSQEILDNWISSFCALVGHEYFAEVSEDFIEDDFNLTGLSSQVPLYKEALEMILDVEPEDDDSVQDFEDPSEDDLELLDDNNRPTGTYVARRGGRLQDVGQIEQSAELLYGLIHQRFITSRPGISQMHEKYTHGHFGVCPRVYCNAARVLPVGLSDTPDTETVKLFCPSCLDVYAPPNSRFQNVDGAFFGTTFGCLFLMTFPEISVAGSHPQAPAERSSETTNGVSQNARVPNDDDDPANDTIEVNGVVSNKFAPGLGKGNIYEPKIYGFRISERARTGPRMKWLRMKPDNLTELNEAKKYRRMLALEATEDHTDAMEEDEQAAEANTSKAANGARSSQQQKVASGKQRSKPRDGDEDQILTDAPAAEG